MANLYSIMNIKPIVIAITSLLATTGVKAGHSNSLQGDACELARISDAMLYSYEKAVPECHMNGRERAFLASLRCMKTMSHRLDSQLSSEAESCVLNKSLQDLNHGYGITVSQANGINLPSSTRRILCDYGNTFRQVKAKLPCYLEQRNEYARRYDRRDDFDHSHREDFDRDRSRDYRRREEVSDRDVLIGALSRLLSGR